MGSRTTTGLTLKGSKALQGLNGEHAQSTKTYPSQAPNCPHMVLPELWGCCGQHCIPHTQDPSLGTWLGEPEFC